MKYLITIALALTLAGCGHRETAQASVDAKAGTDAIAKAATLEQAQIIAKGVAGLLDGITLREATEPMAAQVSAEDWLKAADHSDPVGQPIAAAKVNAAMATDLKALDDAHKTDLLITAGKDTLWWLIGLTGAGGTVLTVGARLFAALRTAKQTAQVAFDGFHQAQTALRSVSPAAADSVDAASLRLQSHLPPAVKALGDAILEKVKPNG